MEKKQVLTCQHCAHVWTYKGNNPYALCPRCRYNVKNIYFQEDKPKFKHFNAGENGVKILDLSLASKTSPDGIIADIYFKDGKAFCEWDRSFDCKHVEFALSLPIVKRIFRKRGWQI